ncbi:MAG: 1-acyl-sn-glycerol-3-phosphate acyltransferase [Ilumatobacteraceae bacterium]|nr:1-acyl-sn-glycerol-3-phosphate acyltransferase [Ilumatobacteraceae bacterium]
MTRALDSTLARTVISIWSWLSLGILLLGLVPLVALIRVATMPFDRGAYWAGYTFRAVARVHGRLNPLWTFTVRGNVPNDPRLPYVVVSNHESFVDMLAISQIPIEMKWVAKSTFFNIPIVGFLLMLSRDIKLVRGAKGGGAHVYTEAANRLSTRTSVMLFPEGTRSASGELGAFKDGAFKIAIEAQAPILPLVVHGTRNALIKHDWRFGRCDAVVQILDPIPTTGMTLEDVDALREQVRDLIAATKADLAAAA